MGNLVSNNQPKKLLTIGGWDPCGAFGVPADLKTFSALGAHGMGVMTVVTAQNSVGWYGAEFMSADFVSKQLDAVLGDYGADGVKTGFIGKTDLIQLIGQKLREYEVPNIVIDPVLINAGGRPMFGPEVTEAYAEWLFPLATAITPNRYELGYLLTGESKIWDYSAESEKSLQSWMGTLEGSPAVIGKGIPQQDGRLADGLFTAQSADFVTHQKVETENVSGTGDTFSAGLVTFLAQSKSLPEAFEAASLGVSRAIEASADWQLGQGPGPISHNKLR